MKTSNKTNFVRRVTFIILLGSVIGMLVAKPALAKLTGSLSEDAIAERLAPVAKVNVAGGGASPAASTTAGSTAHGPKDIFEHNCKMCHGTGVAGAPVFGNKADWAPRIAQGLDTLVKAAWSGIRAMPPKGNCLDCTQDDIKKTVEYMVDAAK